MMFGNTSTVFFDPMLIDGIRLGTGNTADLWLADHRSPRLQELFGPLKETTCQPGNDQHLQARTIRVLQGSFRAYFRPWCMCQADSSGTTW
jgi:hypothetical protein